MLQWNETLFFHKKVVARNSIHCFLFFFFFLFWFSSFHRFLEFCEMVDSKLRCSINTENFNFSFLQLLSSPQSFSLSWSKFLFTILCFSISFWKVCFSSILLRFPNYRFCSDLNEQSDFLNWFSFFLFFWLNLFPYFLFFIFGILFLPPQNIWFVLFVSQDSYS
jgi:hypothetical protein